MLSDTLRTLDRLDSALWTAFNGMTPTTAPMDLRRDGATYTLQADLPGVDPGSIDITVDGRWLTIRAERSTATESERGEWLVRERANARTERRIALGQEIEADKISATYHDGVLTVTVPIAESARPRRIAVEAGSGSGQPALGTHTTVQVQEKGRDEAGRATEVGEQAEEKAQPAHSVAS